MGQCKTEYVEVYETAGRDWITTERDCNITIKANGKEFFANVRGDQIEISGFNATILIEPRGTNMVYITHKEKNHGHVD